MSTPASSTSATIIAVRAVAARHPELAETDLHVTATHTSSDTQWRYVRVQQQHDGVPVEQGLVVVGLDADLQVRWLSGQVVPAAAKLDTTPVRSRGDMVSSVFDADAVRVTQVITTEATQQPRLAWRVVTFGARGRERLIDDRTGRKLYSGSTVHTLNQAWVFPLDPVRTPVTVPVTLPLAAGSWRLVNADFAVHTGLVNAWGQIAGYVQQAGADYWGNFAYIPQDARFAEASALHNLGAALSRFRLLGYRAHRALTVAVNLPNVRNSWYDGRQLAFGSQWGANHALSAQIATHELSHAVVDNLTGLLRRTPESRALHEGLSDYFAATFSEQPRIGVSVALANGQPFMRDLTRTHRYPDDLVPGNDHLSGEIVSSALWALRGRVGAAAADAVAFGAMLATTPTDGFPEFARALEHAASARWGASDARTQQLVAILRQWGLR